jgi:hypothetical protein
MPLYLCNIIITVSESKTMVSHSQYNYIIDARAEPSLGAIWY